MTHYSTFITQKIIMSSTVINLFCHSKQFIPVLVNVDILGIDLVGMDILGIDLVGIDI